MPKLSAADFSDIQTEEALQEIFATGFGPSGEPGTAEHARNVADALAHASEDIFFDYMENNSHPEGYAEAAATHANICSLQAAAEHAAEIMTALANNPELMEQVQAAMDAARSPSPR